MTGILDFVQRASFAGASFACSSISIKGGLRDAVHEYLHTPGGQPEIQGRRLYTFEFDAIYSAEMPQYSGAFPSTWDFHRKKFEEARVEELVVPTLGTYLAYCTDWPIDVNFRNMRDGIKVKLTFRENPGLDPTLEKLSIAGFDALTGSFIEEVDAAKLDISIFDQIMNALADIEAAKLYGEFVVEVYLDKVNALLEACTRLEESVTELGDPKNWKVAQMIREIGVNAIVAKEDALLKLLPIIEFTCPAVMSIVDVSTSLYGNTTRVQELLNLNRDPIIIEPFAIPPGTVLRAYTA